MLYIWFLLLTNYYKLQHEVQLGSYFNLVSDKLCLSISKLFSPLRRGDKCYHCLDYVMRHFFFQLSDDALHLLTHWSRREVVEVQSTLTADNGVHTLTQVQFRQQKHLVKVRERFWEVLVKY